MAITIHNRHRILGREWWTTEWAGLSTDDKTTIEDVKVNDLFFEEDTGDFYYFDGEDWEKVGSGGSTQTELPKITISMTPNKQTEVMNNVNCFYDGNYPVYYDKYGNAIDIATWDDMISFNANETKTVVAYAKENEGIYDTRIGFCIMNFISATSSNEVNCTYAGGIIEVTDPTQEASITLAVSAGSLG